MNLRKKSISDEPLTSRKTSIDKNTTNLKKPLNTINSKSSNRSEEDLKASTNNLDLYDKINDSQKNIRFSKRTDANISNNDKNFFSNNVKNENLETQQKTLRKIVAYSSLNKLLQRSITLFKKNQFFLNPTRPSINKNDIDQINYDCLIENSANIQNRLSLINFHKEVINSPISKLKLDVLSKEVIEQINIFHDDLNIKKKFNKYDLLLSDLNANDNDYDCFEKPRLNEKNINDDPIYKKSKNKTDLKLIQIDLKENFQRNNNNNFLNLGINKNSDNNMKIKKNYENNLKTENFQIPAENKDEQNFKGKFKVIDDNNEKLKFRTSIIRDHNIRFKSDDILNIKRFDKGNNQNFDFNSNASLKNKINIYDPIKSKELKNKILGENKILKNTIDNGKKFNSFKNSYLNKDNIALKNFANLNAKMPIIKNHTNQIENFNDIAKYKSQSSAIINGNDLIIKDHLTVGITPSRIVSTNRNKNTSRPSIANLDFNAKIHRQQHKQENKGALNSSRSSNDTSKKCETKSISSINYKAPKFSLAVIEREKHLLHEYIKQNYLDVDIEPIYGKFGRPRTTNRKIDFGFTFSKDNYKNYNNPEYQFYKHLSQDPSLGPNYLENHFPDHYYQKIEKQRQTPSNIHCKDQILTEKPDYFYTCKSFYKNNLKDNYASKTFRHFLFSKKINKDLDSVKYQLLKKTKYAQSSKIKIKWKTIKWLMEHEKNVVKRLVNFHRKFKENPQNQEKSYSREEFYQLMRSNGISNNPDLINKLFWVFDANEDDQLKIKELALGLEMFRDSSLEEKLKAFYDLCDEDDSGSVSKNEFMKILKNNMVKNDEKATVKQVIDKIYAYYNLDDKGELTFEKFKEACIHNKAFCDIIEKNLDALKSIDNDIDRDLKNNLIVFNQNLSEDLRLKLLDVNSSFMPIRDKKFEKIIGDYAKNRQNILDYCWEKEERLINNLLEEDHKNDASIFVEEREHIRKHLRSTNRK